MLKGRFGGVCLVQSCRRDHVCSQRPPDQVWDVVCVCLCGVFGWFDGSACTLANAGEDLKIHLERLREVVW